MKEKSKYNLSHLLTNTRYLVVKKVIFFFENEKMREVLDFYLQSDESGLRNKTIETHLVLLF